MPTFSLSSLFSLLVGGALFGQATVLQRAPQTTFALAQYTNSTTTSTVSSTVTDAPALCTGCEFGEPGYRVHFFWPVLFTTESVLATVIYKVGPNNVTSTMTRYNNETLKNNQYSVLDAAQWNVLLSTTGVTVENGTPHFPYVTTIYSAPGAPMTVSTTL
jgi:hypothetical protein